MNTRLFQLLIIGLPLFAFVTLYSCSEDSSNKEETTKEKKEEQKPLVERNEDVKEYFEVLNDIIGEYMDVAETTLTILEKLDSGKLNVMDAAVASGELVESMSELEELNESLTQQGTIKENVEAKLNAKDLIKFNKMYSESLVRVDSLSARLDSLDIEAYLKKADVTQLFK